MCVVFYCVFQLSFDLNEKGHNMAEHRLVDTAKGMISCMLMLDVAPHDPLQSITHAAATLTKDKVFRGAGINLDKNNQLSWLYSILVKCPKPMRMLWLRFFGYLQGKYVPLLFDVVVFVLFEYDCLDSDRVTKCLVLRRVSS